MKQSLNKSSPPFRPNFIFSLMMGVMVLIFVITSANALTLTNAEYFWDTDPGQGLATPITVTPGTQININSLSAPSTGISGNFLHALFIRYRSDSLGWGMAVGNWVFVNSNNLFQGNVTHVRYWYDSQAPTQVDVTDAPQVNYISAIPSTGLTDGLHTFNVEYLSGGVWNGLNPKYFLVSANTTVVKLVTHAEYWYDSLPSTVVDVADAATVNYINNIPSTGLASNLLHSFNIRYRDDSGNWGLPVSKLFFIDQNNLQVRLVTHAEYWFDNLTTTVVDIADAPTVNYAPLVASAGLGVGLHSFNLRFSDDLGNWGMTNTKNFVVVNLPPPPGSASRLAASEFYINVDPGVGNGIPIPTPQDGVWDEQTEEVLTVVTGLPAGIHQFCLRYKDDLNNWSMEICDTLQISPVLVIRAVPGTNDIILDWLCDLSGAPFHVYRANTLNGTYTEIGTSNTLSYTDVGIIASQALQFYNVAFTRPAGLSNFRLPARPQSLQTTE